MRTQSVYELLESAQIEKSGGFFPSNTVIKSIPELRHRLEILREIPGYESEAEWFSASIVFRTTKAAIEIQPQEWDELKARWSSYIEHLRGLKQYLASILSSQSNESIFIKLPPSNDLTESAEFMKTFDKLVKQLVLHPSMNGKVEIHNCERGSIWIELYLGVPAAVGLIGGVAWAAAVVYKKVQEGRLLAEQLESLKIKNDSLVEIQQAQKSAIDILVEAEAKNLANSNYKTGIDQESIERLKHTIREFSVLIGKGAEIHAALQAPESVRNLFPDFQNLAMISSKTKEISNVPITPAATT